MVANKTGGGVGTTRTRDGRLVLKGQAKRQPMNMKPLFLGAKDTVQDYLNSMGQYDLLTWEQEQMLGQAMEAGRAAAEKLALADNLSSYEKRKLRIAVEDGKIAKNQFIEANLRLVVSEAKRIPRQGMPLEDLIQEGNIGLMRAVEKYDWRTGYKFSTYATAWIRQFIRRGIAGSARSIRLPAHAVESYYAVLEAKRVLREQEGKREDDITPEDVARVSQLPLKKVKEVLSYPANPQSLSMLVDAEGGTELQDMLPEQTAEEPDAAVISNMRAADVHRLMATALNEREISVLRMRFGMSEHGELSGDGSTLEEIGQYHGCTRERARQIEAQALMKLRQAQGNIFTSTS